MKKTAYANKMIGSRFEGDVRKALRLQKYFIYSKGSSTKGIDIFALRGNKAI